MVFLNVEAVSAILKDGTLISTRLGSNIAWYRNIVYKSEGSTVYLAFVEQYLNNAVFPGSNISLKYVNEYFIYLFEGVIQSICMVNPGYVAVKVTSAEEIINTRLSPRYDIYMPADLKPIWDDVTYSSVVTDISFGGTAFTCTHKFDYNEELEITIHLPVSQTVYAKGKVIRKSMKSGVIDYSIQFTEIDEDNCNLLSRYFSSLEAEMSEMHAQFISEVKGKL